MLEIVIELDQRDIVPRLKELFPDIWVDRHLNGVIYCLATLEMGVKGTQQLNFLRCNALSYTDIEREIQQKVEAFFRGVEVEGIPIKYILFGPIPADPTYYGVTLLTEDNEIHLHFPPHWR